MTRRLLGTGKKVPKPAKKEDLGHPMDTALVELERAKADLAVFRAQHHQVIERYEELRSELVTAFETAKACYVQHKDQLGPSYGGFSVEQRRYVDATRLIALKPDLLPYVKYAMSVKDLDTLVADGLVDEETAEQVITIKDSISGPKT